jgi:tetratricopeptide (TPR) repeat protein
VLPQLHRDLETICLQALAKAPARRYSSAAALAEDLERFCTGEAILARREGLVSRAWRKVRRNRLVSAAVLLAVLAVVIAGYAAPRVYRDRQAAALDRRIASLSGDLEAGLQAPELTPEYFQQMETRLTELEGLAVDRAAAFRPRLHQGFADRIRSRFRDRLAPDDIPQLREAVALLLQCDPELAGRVGRELEERLARWEPIFELNAPFASLPEVFARGRVRLEQQDGSALLAPVRQELTVATAVACAGRVQLEAVFHASWQTASRLGPVLNAGQGTGYHFLVLTPAPTGPATPPGKPQPPASFEEVRRAGGTISLVILRNQVVLQERRVPAGELFEGPAGALRLVAQREGEELSFQVNRLKPLEAREVFPLSTAHPGVFALVWPLKVRLQGLRALHQASPVTASALEEGDDRYNQADYERALISYQKVRGASPAEAIRREARYKEGLCLLALNREDEAIVVLDEIAAHPGDRGRWASLADSQLLLIHLRRKDLPSRLQVEAILDRLAVRHGSRSQELALSLTPAERHEIYKSYCGAGVGFLLRKPEDVVQTYERAGRAAALFAPDARAHFNIQLLLVRAYRLAGREREALEKCGELLRDFGEVFRVHGVSATSALEEYGWLLRQRNRPGDRMTALAAVNRWLLGEGGIRPTRDGAAYLLLLERARIHAAMQKADLAEKDLELFFRQQ